MKTIVIGADHRGFELKQEISIYLQQKGYTVQDVGADHKEHEDDFVDFAALVGSKISTDNTLKGILICGSGVGMSIAANKIPSVRCAVGHTEEEIRLARQDDDINILSLPADFLSKEEAERIVETFLTTAFSPEERHVRRIAKITSLDHA